MATESTDLLVVGAGPAGTATALAARRAGLTVSVVDRPRGRRVRFCDSVSPEFRALLVHLGLWELFQNEQHLRSPGVRSAWGQQAAQSIDYLFSPFGAGWHLDRSRFDALLRKGLEAAAVSLRCGEHIRVCARESEKELWRIELSDGGRPAEFEARFLVDATGRAAHVARQQGARRRALDRLVGVLCELPCDPAAAEHRLVVESSETGWWYWSPSKTDRFLVAYMTDGDLLARPREAIGDSWLRELKRTRHISALVVPAPESPRLAIVSANTAALDRFTGSGWLAVGDAAASMDPLSGQGIHRALEAGLRAGAVIARHLAGDWSALTAYTSWVNAIWRENIEQRSRYYALDRRWIEAPFWRRRQRS